MLSHPALTPWSTTAISDLSYPHAVTTPSPISADPPAISGHGMRIRRATGSCTSAASTPPATSHDQVAYGMVSASASRYPSTATGASSPYSTSSRPGLRTDHANTPAETSIAEMPSIPLRAPKPDQSSMTSWSSGAVTTSATND